MTTNLQKYKADLERLVGDSGELQNAISAECEPKRFAAEVSKKLGDKAESFLQALPDFGDNYQRWYSESIVVIKSLLPDRLDDFVRLYEKPKGRKSISHENYVIEDYLQNLQVTNGIGDVVVSRSSAIPRFIQQRNILRAAAARFESALFDIEQLARADLFDSELDAATELNKKGFMRGAGAMAGVILEKHLGLVCSNHGVKVKKKDPSINDLNQALYDAAAIEVKDWRFIQHLADLRNLCDHKKPKDPSKADVDDLIEGTKKVIKKIS